MGILADWQIEEANIITPFLQGGKTPGRISAGLSSYGYDARVGHKFKVFSPVHCGVVDPKHFDPKNFVDVDLTPRDHSWDREGICTECGLFIEGTEAEKPCRVVPDHVLIPPNSFALAETVETFRIPRDVLAVCLGKCLTGDTRLFYPQTGEYKPILEHVAGAKVIAADFSSATSVQTVESASSDLIRNGRKPVFVVKTHSGSKIKATANHPFMRYGPHGTWTALKDLRAGDEIAVVGNLPYFGEDHTLSLHAVRLMALLLADGRCKTTGSSPVYSKQDPVLVEMLKEAARDVLGCEVTQAQAHHYRIVNRTGRGGVQTKNRASQWLALHGIACKSADKVVPATVFKSTRERVAEFLRVLFTGDGSLFLQNKSRKTPSVVVEYSSASRRLCEDIQHLLLRFGVRGTLRTKVVSGKDYFKYTIHRKGDIARFFAEIGFSVGSFKDTLYTQTISRYVEAAVPAQSIIPDRIVSIEPAGEENVYDIEVPKFHNFVAENLIVHNSSYARCGIVINCTPLEPAWQGVVTIEISNTTPLPAKVYAGEGIMQILFFQGEPCRVSYADKKGKYQHQTGITLPRID